MPRQISASAAAAAAGTALLALQAAPLVAADAETPTSSTPVSLGEACSSGGNIIGITLDSSGSISSPEFEAARIQVTNFVDATSGLPNTNDNLYFLNLFSSVAYGGTGPLMTNAGRQVSDTFEAVDRVSGGTDIIAGMQDIQAAFEDAAIGAGVAIVVTDGGCCTEVTLKAAGDDLRALGVTVVAVGIDSADQDSLEAFASTGMDGSPLVFTGEQFDQIESLLVGALQDIDSDADGVSDCEDGCPSDALKTAAGNCGCGVPEDCGMAPHSDRGLDFDYFDYDYGSMAPQGAMGAPMGAVPEIGGPPESGSYGCDEETGEGCWESPGRERHMRDPRRPRTDERRERNPRRARAPDAPRQRRDRAPRDDRERRPRGDGGYGEDVVAPVEPAFLPESAMAAPAPMSA